MKLIQKDGNVYLLDEVLLHAVCVDSLNVQVSTQTKIVLEKFYRHVLTFPAAYCRVATRNEGNVLINDFTASKSNGQLVREKRVWVLEAEPESPLLYAVQSLAGYMEYEGKFSDASILPVSVLLDRAKKYAANAAFRSKTFRTLDDAPVVFSHIGYELRELRTPEQFAYEAKRLAELTGQDYGKRFEQFKENSLRVFYVSSQGRPVLTMWLEHWSDKPLPEMQSYYPQQRDYRNFALVDVDYYPTPDVRKREAYTEAEDVLIPIMDFLGLNTGVRSGYYKIGKTRSGQYQRIDRIPRDSTLVLSTMNVRGVNYQLPLGFTHIEADDLGFYGCPKVVIPAISARELTVEGCNKFVAGDVKATTARMLGTTAGDSSYTLALTGGYAAFTNLSLANIRFNLEAATLYNCAKIAVSGDDPKHVARRLALSVDKLDLGGALALDTQVLTLAQGVFTNANLAAQFPNCKELVQDHANLRSLVEHSLQKYTILGYDQSTNVLPGKYGHLAVQTLTVVPDLECDSLSVEYGGDGHHQLFRKFPFIALDGHADFLLASQHYQDLYLFPATAAKLATYIGKSLTAGRIILRLCAPISSLDLVKRLVENMQGHLTLIADDATWFPPGWVDGVQFATSKTKLRVFDVNSLMQVYRSMLVCR